MHLIESTHAQPAAARRLAPQGPRLRAQLARLGAKPRRLAPQGPRLRAQLARLGAKPRRLRPDRGARP